LSGGEGTVKRAVGVLGALPLAAVFLGAAFAAEAREKAKGWQEMVVYFRVKGRKKPFACHLKEVAPVMERVYRRLYGEVEVVTGYEGPLEAPPTLKGRRRAQLVREIENIVRRMEELNRSFFRGRISHSRYVREYRRLWGLYWSKIWQLWVTN